MLVHKKNFVKKIRITLAALVIILGAGGTMAMKADQVQTYYRGDGDNLVLLPGGADGEGSQWSCNSGSSICGTDGRRISGGGRGTAGI